METYGLQENDIGTEISVDTDYPMIVGFAPFLGRDDRVIFLDQKDVGKLVRQLTGWLENQRPTKG